MRQKTSFIALAVGLVLANAFALYLICGKVNHLRIDIASDLYNKAQQAENEQDKLISLIQSDFLVPNSQKKQEIAHLYLENGDFENGLWYLKSVKNQEGYLMSAEAALEYKKYDEANQFIHKITNRQAKTELETYLAIVKDENLKKIGVISEDTATNLGAILYALDSSNFNAVTENTVIGQKIVAINRKYASGRNRDLNIVKMLIEENQPALARILLSKLEKSGIVSVFILEAESYALQDNYKAALNRQLKAISEKPADINLYIAAVQYAEAAGDTKTASELKNTMKYLESLQK